MRDKNLYLITRYCWPGPYKRFLISPKWCQASRTLSHHLTIKNFRYYVNHVTVILHFSSGKFFTNSILVYNLSYTIKQKPKNLQYFWKANFSLFQVINTNASATEPEFFKRIWYYTFGTRILFKHHEICIFQRTQ